MTEPLLSSIKNTRFYREVKEEGLLDGIAKGKEEGREEGRIKGIEQGLLRTARNMLAKGLDNLFDCGSDGAFRIRRFIR